MLLRVNFPALSVFKRGTAKQQVYPNRHSLTCSRKYLNNENNLLIKRNQCSNSMLGPIPKKNTKNQTKSQRENWRKARNRETKSYARQKNAMTHKPKRNQQNGAKINQLTLWRNMHYKIRENRPETRVGEVLTPSWLDSQGCGYILKLCLVSVCRCVGEVS